MRLSLTEDMAVVTLGNATVVKTDLEPLWKRDEERVWELS